MVNGAPFEGAVCAGHRSMLRCLSESAGDLCCFAFVTSLRATDYSLASLDGSNSGKEREGDGEKRGFVCSIRCV